MYLNDTNYKIMGILVTYKLTVQSTTKNFFILYIMSYNQKWYIDHIIDHIHVFVFTGYYTGVIIKLLVEWEWMVLTI